MANIIQPNFINTNVVSKHININMGHVNDKNPWYAQLGAHQADIGVYNDSFQPVSGVLLYSSQVKGDINSTYTCLNVGQSETLQLDDKIYDWEHNNIYIKFYQIMPPKTDTTSDINKRLTYSVYDPEDASHENEKYTHPQIIQVNDDGQFRIPGGQYGRRGWEVLIISKEQSANFFVNNMTPFIPTENIKLIDKVKSTKTDTLNGTYKTTLGNYLVRQEKSMQYVSYPTRNFTDNFRFQQKADFGPYQTQQMKEFAMNNNNTNTKYKLVYDNMSKYDNSQSYQVTTNPEKQTVTITITAVDGNKESKEYYIRPDKKIIIMQRGGASSFKPQSAMQSTFGYDIPDKMIIAGSQYFNAHMNIAWNWTNFKVSPSMEWYPTTKYQKQTISTYQSILTWNDQDLTYEAIDANSSTIRSWNYNTKITYTQVANSQYNDLIDYDSKTISKPINIYVDIDISDNSMSCGHTQFVGRGYAYGPNYDKVYTEMLELSLQCVNMPHPKGNKLDFNFNDYWNVQMYLYAIHDSDQKCIEFNTSKNLAENETYEDKFDDRIWDWAKYSNFRICTGLNGMLGVTRRGWNIMDPNPVDDYSHTPAFEYSGVKYGNWPMLTTHSVYNKDRPDLGQVRADIGLDIDSRGNTYATAIYIEQ